MRPTIMNLGLVLALTLMFSLPTFFAKPAHAASSDVLGRQQIKVDNPNSDVVLNELLGDVRSILTNFRPAVDSSTRIVSPLQVSGSSTHPFMQVTMEKCVFLICQTVEMKADMKATEETGKCTKNIVLFADLSRSSATLSQTYNALYFSVCYNKSQDGRGTLNFVGYARRAPGYSGGVVQNEVFKLLQLQVPAITSAVNKVLKSKSQVR